MTMRGFLMGMLVGSMVGVIMGVVFAPQEGSATRQQISDKAKNAADKVAGAAGSVKEKVTRRREKIEQAI